MLPFGNSSGIGPQGYGAQPTPFEALWAANNQQSSMQLMQWAALSDPTVNAATRTAVDLVAGTDSWGPWSIFGRNTKADYAGNADNPDYKFKDNTYEEFLSTPLGTMAQTGMTAIAMNTSMFGGSLGQMAFGMQQMLGSGGFRMDGGRLSGAGFVTDLTSQHMIDSVRDNFFDPTSGFSNYRAQGMDKDDFGELGFMMSRRGMFAGMDIGGMTRIDSRENYRKYIEDLNAGGFSQIAKEAQNHLNSIEEGAEIDFQAFKPNVDTFKKINAMFADAAETVSQFRDVFGADKSVSALIQEAEKLSGMSYGDTGANEFARSKLQSLKTLSQASGADLHSMLAADQVMATASASQMAHMYGGLPSDYARMAAAQTPLIWESSTIALQNRAEASKIMADKGYFVNSVSQDEMITLSTLGANRILGESPTVVEALYAADTMSNLSAETKQAIFDKVGEMGKAGTPEARAKINAELQQIMIANKIDPGRLLEQAGGDPSELFNAMSQGTLQKAMRMVTENDAARTLDLTLPAIIDATSSGERLGIGDDDKSMLLLKTMVGTLGTETITTITENLKSGNDAEVSRIIESKDALLRQSGLSYDNKSGAEAFKKLLSDVHAETKAQMGGKDGFELGTGIDDIYHKLLTNPEFVNFAPTEDREEYKAQAVNRTLLNKSLGNQRMSKDNIFEQIARGFFGEGEVSDSSVIGYMLAKDELKGNVKTYDITNESAGNLTAEQLDELGKQIGGDTLDKALGIKRKDGKITNYDEVKERLSTSAGVFDLITALDSSGVAWDTVSKDGTNSRLHVADKESSKIVRGVADETNRANAALALQGGLSAEQRAAELQRISDLADDQAASEIRAIQNKAVKAFVGGKDKDVDAIVQRMAEGDNDAIRGVKDSGSQEQITKRMRERIEELGEDARDGDKEAKQKLINYQDVLNKIDGSGTDAVMRVEMIIDDRAWGTLYNRGG